MEISSQRYGRIYTFTIPDGTSIDQVEKLIDAARLNMHERGMSDDFYYTNGRRDRDLAYLEALEDLKRQLNT